MCEHYSSIHSGVGGKRGERGRAKGTVVTNGWAFKL